MIETYKEFVFEAAHSLPPHASLHGHSFKVCLYLSGDPDPVYGWPVNLNEVDRHVHKLVKQLNHRHLNEIEGLALPSMENIARWIWDRLRGPVPALTRISVNRGFDGRAEGCIYNGRL